MKLDGCHALITGASAGIGREFAWQLATRARSLVLIARREERLVELHDELKQRYSNVAVSVRKADLAELAQIHELVAWLDHEGIDVDLLINNAGLGDSGDFATSDPVRDEQMTLVNVVALTTLTRRLLPKMIARGHGSILNVSSSAAFLPIPNCAVYAATKAYVNSFSEALRVELRGSGVDVCSLCPGPVHTEFQEVAKRPGSHPDRGPEFVHVSVQQVVQDALAALEANKPLIIPGFPMKLGMFLVRIIPMPLLRLLLHGARRRD
jgi:hypothetical protein